VRAIRIENKHLNSSIHWRDVLKTPILDIAIFKNFIFNIVIFGKMRVFRTSLYFCKIMFHTNSHKNKPE
jgi:hypothetical protein